MWWAKSAGEVHHSPEHDDGIVNRHIEESVGLVRAIVTPGRLKRAWQVGLGDFANHLRVG